MNNALSKFFNFCKETKQEIEKVSWPNWTSLRTSGTVVILSMTILGFYISIVDALIHQVINLLVDLATC